MSCKNITGKRFGMLTVIKDKFGKRNNKITRLCQCDCGNTIEVTIDHLGKDTNSCGCIRRNRNKVRMTERMKSLSDRDCLSIHRDGLGYMGIHARIRRHKAKPTHCEKCGIGGVKLELSNISGEYLLDENDYEYLCTKCHMKHDGRYTVYSQKELKGENTLCQ